MPEWLFRKWCAAVVWLVAILREQMFKWHQLRAERGRERERMVDWAANKGRPVSHNQTNNRETIHLARDERREAEGTRTSAGRLSHLYMGGFHLADDGKNMYTSLWSACGKDGESKG